MLSAQKKLLEASVAEQGAQLQSSELTYFENNFGSMNTMASVIGGFAFSGILIPTAYDTDGFLDGNNTWAVDFFYGFASLSVGCCMAAAITCTIVNVRGPGLALRGPDGSLKRAVDGMRRYQKQVLYCLATGVVSFHMEGMLYAWIALHKDSSQIVTTVIFTVFLCAMVAIAITVFYSFNIEGRMVEGMFTERRRPRGRRAVGERQGHEGELDERRGAVSHVRVPEDVDVGKVVHGLAGRVEGDDAHVVIEDPMLPDAGEAVGLGAAGQRRLPVVPQAERGVARAETALPEGLERRRGTVHVDVDPHHRGGCGPYESCPHQNSHVKLRCLR